MHRFYILISVWVTVLLPGCSRDKGRQVLCDYQHTAGTIAGIAGPDSARANEQQALTVDVAAPGLCVADVKVTATPYNDTISYLNADVQYSAGNSGDCNCEVSDHHYVRVYLTAPAAGTIVLSAPPGIGPVPSHSISVY